MSDGRVCDGAASTTVSAVQRRRTTVMCAMQKKKEKKTKPFPFDIAKINCQYSRLASTKLLFELVSNKMHELQQQQQHQLYHDRQSEYGE